MVEPRLIAVEYTLKTKLFPFQRDTVERVKAFNGRCLLALEMGLGKSLVSLTYICETKSFPAVIVCPASLKFNWAAEAHKHFDKSVTILDGRDPQKQGTIMRSGDKIFVLNYDILPSWLPVLKAIKPEIIVADESQFTKNRNTKRTKALAELAYFAPKFLALTGTPMTKGDPTELWTCLNMLFKGKIVSQYAFMNRYCKWHNTRYGTKVTGPKNLPELNAFLNNRCMVRYRCEDVLPDLPPFIRQTSLLEMTAKQSSEYNKAQEEFYLWLLEKYPDRQVPKSDMAVILTQFGYLKRLAAEFKIPAIIEKIDNFLANNEGKLIIFGIHKKMLQAVWDVYAKQNKSEPFIVRIDGSTSAQHRSSAVYNFQETDYTRLALLQMQSGGTGLTLTAAQHSMFMELDFLPSTHLQCEARNRRIGSTGSFVHYDYLVIKDSIEEDVMDKLFVRQNTFSAVIDGKEDVSGQFNLMQDLLRKQFNRRG